MSELVISFNFSIHFILISACTLNFILRKRVDVQKSARSVSQEFDFQHLNGVPEFAHARKALPHFRLSRDYPRYDPPSHANALASVSVRLPKLHDKSVNLVASDLENRMRSEMEDCRR